MNYTNFTFISDAPGVNADQFAVVNFTGNEAISKLYRYEIEIRSPQSAVIALDDILDSPARFISELDGHEYPVYGVLSSFEELQTALGYVHYRAVLVPRLWLLSIYKTNEIYTTEKTVDNIISDVLENAGLYSSTDFDLRGLVTTQFLERDYVCQFGESDFDFISRLMENEGIFYYFEHGAKSPEKIIFINDMNYESIHRPGLNYNNTASGANQNDNVDAWICRKQRLPASVSVRNFNPAHPSLDISDSMPIDNMGQGEEYSYGENIESTDEASYLSEIRAGEQLCSRTRFYGESGVTRLQAGYLFALDGHSNSTYNNVEYLTVEVNHEGQQLDMDVSTGSSQKTQSTPHYRNSFVAIKATEQFRPARVTPKPHFYGTMTAFIYAETGNNKAEIDDLGRYRVHLPFDRAEGTDYSDPHRKASTWIRMAQPYVGQEQGMYFRLRGGTEVLLTFINGDPDQPIISGALPNGLQPSLLTSETNFVRNITTDAVQTVSGNTHNVSQNSARIALLEDPPSAANPTVDEAPLAHFINDGNTETSVKTTKPAPSMIPPWDSLPLTDPAPAYDEQYVKFKSYDENFVATDMTQDDIDKVSTDRGAGDNYVYANARTFVYPQHERVYFIGSFHEDFHVKDDFTNPDNSWTGQKEVFHFPAPGGDATQTQKGESTDTKEEDVNPSGVRGVSEARFWGDQMNYAWGRSFNWAGGPALEGGESGSFAEYNYGNGYTENLQITSAGTSADLPADKKEHHDDYKTYGEFIGATNLASASVEKTFGTTYSYQNGFSLDIKVGNSYERVYGDKNEEVHGHAVSHVYGSTHSTQEGAVSEMFFGAKNEFAFDYTNSMCAGASTDFYGGLKGEFNLAGSIGLCGGAALDVFVGFKADLALARALELYIGTLIEIKIGGVLEYTDVAKVTKGPGEIDCEIVGGKIRAKDTDLELTKAGKLITGPLISFL